MKNLVLTALGHSFTITVNEGGGLISSDLKEDCPFCSQPNCYNHCDQSQGEWDAETDDIEVETEDEVDSRRRWNFGVSAIESLILAHACAGVRVLGSKYRKGIEVAIEALSNNR